MDCKNVGLLIAELRKEKGYTQLALARALNISDRTVSKWERGTGCPDVSLLGELSKVLGTNVEAILRGQRVENTAINGNVRKSKIYYCPQCGNIVVGLGEAEIVCCGRKLEQLKAQKPEGAHSLTVESAEDEWYITSSHPMSKEHYISAVMWLSGDKMQMVKLYPEQDLEIRFKRSGLGELYFICNKHGLFAMTLKA